MIELLGNLLKHHLRLGYVNALLIFDAALLVIVAGDIYRFVGRGLSLPLALRFDPGDVPVQVRANATLLAGFFLLALPIILALLRIVVGRGMWMRGRWTKGGAITVALHSVASVLLVYFCIVGFRMQIISGYEVISGHDYGGEVPLSFSSVYYKLVHSGVLNWIFRSAISLAGAAMAAVVGFVLIGKGPGRQIELYEVRAALADLPGELRPVLSCARYSFDEGGASTEIEFVRDFEERTVQEYSRRNPGSKLACMFVEQVFTDCRTRLEKLLLPPDVHSPSVTIAPDVQKALESLLEGVPDPKRILVMPFAEPHVISAVRRYRKLGGSEVQILTLDPENWTLPWQQQQDLILQQITGNDQPTVVIVTEVSYATGLRFPMNTFVPRIRERVHASDLRIIIDGSAGAGNRSSAAAVREADAYVFTTDRWLLSTAPFGVSMSFKGFPVGSLGWTCDDGRIPASYSDARRFSNLLGSLELLSKYEFKRFWDRCSKLREEFLKLLPSTMQIIGEGTGLEQTFCQTVCPVKGKKWRFDGQELADQLQERLIYAPVLYIDPTMPWVRVSLPYFLDVREVNRLCDTLTDLVR